MLTAYLLKWIWAVEKYQAPLAQRIRAPGFGPGGRGFESLTEYQSLYIDIRDHYIDFLWRWPQS